VLELRRTTPDDHAALRAIVQEDSVARWGWADLDDEELESGFAIVVDGDVHGFLEFDEETEPSSRHVAFDIFLSTAAQGRGYGREALRRGVAHFAARGHHRFTIDPAVANERAIRCYAAVGFKPVGVLREHERGPDGTWHDNLLMDLLVADLEPA
jgi:aminoglycoside 6'-N-acetyltransferase